MKRVTGVLLMGAGKWAGSVHRETRPPPKTDPTGPSGRRRVSFFQANVEKPFWCSNHSWIF